MLSITLRQLEYATAVARTESVSLAESPFAETDVFDHAPGSRGALDYQALYEELKANDFLAIAA